MQGLPAQTVTRRRRGLLPHVFILTHLRTCSRLSRTSSPEVGSYFLWHLLEALKLARKSKAIAIHFFCTSYTWFYFRTTLYQCTALARCPDFPPPFIHRRRLLTYLDPSPFIEIILQNTNFVNLSNNYQPTMSN